MLRLTRKTDYGLVALARLAEAQDAGEQPLSARQVAQEFGLPLPLLMNVFKDLQRAGLVHSTRGARGGYELADRPERIDLVRVVEAFEGPVQVAVCCEDEAPNEPCPACALTPRCPTTAGVRVVNEKIIGFLKGVTIRDLMKAAIDVPIQDVGLRTGQPRDTTLALTEELP